MSISRKIPFIVHLPSRFQSTTISSHCPICKDLGRSEACWKPPVSPQRSRMSLFNTVKQAIGQHNWRWSTNCWVGGPTLQGWQRIWKIAAAAIRSATWALATSLEISTCCQVPAQPIVTLRLFPLMPMKRLISWMRVTRRSSTIGITRFIPLKLSMGGTSSTCRDRRRLERQQCSAWPNRRAENILMLPAAPRRCSLATTKDNSIWWTRATRRSKNRYMAPWHSRHGWSLI